MRIREAVESDFEGIFSLTKELAEFQHGAEKVKNSVEQMRAEKNFFRCFVAETENKEIVGAVSCFFAYFSWVGKSLFVDDLYVKEAFRGRKIGSRLLEKIFDLAEREGCKRVRWQVSKWNRPAIDLYEKLGGDIDDELFNCTFDADAIREVKKRL